MYKEYSSPSFDHTFGFSCFINNDAKNTIRARKVVVK